MLLFNKIIKIDQFYDSHLQGKLHLPLKIKLSLLIIAICATDCTYFDYINHFNLYSLISERSGVKRNQFLYRGKKYNSYTLEYYNLIYLIYIYTKTHAFKKNTNTISKINITYPANSVYINKFLYYVIGFFNPEDIGYVSYKKNNRIKYLAKLQLKILEELSG